MLSEGESDMRNTVDLLQFAAASSRGATSATAAFGSERATSAENTSTTTTAAAAAVLYGDSSRPYEVSREARQPADCSFLIISMAADETRTGAAGPAQNAPIIGNRRMAGICPNCYKTGICASNIVGCQDESVHCPDRYNDLHSWSSEASEWEAPAPFDLSSNKLRQLDEFSSLRLGQPGGPLAKNTITKFHRLTAAFAGMINLQKPHSAGRTKSPGLIVTLTHEDPALKAELNRHVAFIDSKDLGPERQAELWIGDEDYDDLDERLSL
ncbi:amphoterin-induced protein 1 [Lates japonicus]|uniref:Amphoterin-induced protein 1 n=1 Tax=Lates japonicus TaxID=270547 RepID=A0AAD3M218_LATJO|nr:amphoterin-induced protein 1 [Lates japonicus]